MMVMKLNTQKIEKELKRLGWTRADLARALNVHRQAVYIFLAQDTLPRLGTVEKYARALGVDPKDLIKG